MGQLFFDTGKGFNEIESAKFQISETNTWKRIEIGLPSVSVVRIRLDPDVASGTYLFRDFQVANVLGLSKTRLDLNALVLNGSTSATTEQIKSASIDGDVLRLETTEAANDPQVVLFKVSSQDQTMRGHLLLATSVLLALITLLLAIRLNPRKSRDLTVVATSMVITVAGLELVGRQLWDVVELPFSNPMGVVGPLTLAQFNPTTNILRFLLYIASPVFLALVFSPVIGRFFRSRNVPDVAALQQRYGKWLVFTSYAALFCFALATSISLLTALPSLTYPLDTFHEGEFLTPAFNFVSDKGTWLGSLFVHGAFYDPLATALSWKVWGIQSIGAMRLTLGIWDALVPVAVAFLLWSLAKCSAAVIGSEDRLSVSLFLMTILFVYIVTKGQYQTFGRRDVPLLIGLSLLLLFFRNRHLPMMFVAGAFSALIYAVSIDRGAYYTATFIVAAIGASIAFRDYRVATAGLLGMVVGWLGFVWCFGMEETRAFASTTLILYKTKDLFDAYIYPKPLSLTATLDGGLMAANVVPKIIAFCLALSVVSAIVERSKLVSAYFLALMVLCLLSVFYYRSALGRSDHGHIIYASSFAIITAGYLIATSIRFIGERTAAALTAILVVVNVSLIWQPIKTIFSADLSKFVTGIVNVRNQIDEEFLTEPEKSAIARLKQIFAKEECIFNYTSEAAVPYLLKKPSCGRIHIVWFASAAPLREELIAGLKQHNPAYILFKSPHWANAVDGINNSVRFPDVDAEIRARYSPFEDVNGWVVYKRNDESVSG